MDPNPQVAGKGFEILRRAGLSVEEVEDGLLCDHARRIIEAFACHVTTRRPLVTAKVGMSLDGRIGTFNGNDRWITSHASREFSQKLRLESDALLVGVGTVLADDPQLTYRGPAAKRRGLIRVVLDSRLRTPPTARLFESTPSAPVLIFCGSDAPDTRRRRLEKKGAEIITVPSLKRGLDARRILLELGKRNVLGLLVEGGSEIHWYFLSHQLTDKFYFIIAPVVLGGKCSVPSVGGQGYGSIGEAPRFAVRSQFRMGPDVILETYPSYSKSILSPWLPSETAPFPEPDPLPALRKK